MKENPSLEQLLIQVKAYALTERDAQEVENNNDEGVSGITESEKRNKERCNTRRIKIPKITHNKLCLFVFKK